jgi:Flp pilus assembly protein TadD
MSIIHDALKKAQEQRKGSTAGVPFGGNQPEAKKKPSVLLIAVVLAIAVAVVVYLYVPAFHRGKTPPPQGPKAPVSSPAGVAKTSGLAQSSPGPEAKPQATRTATAAAKPQPVTQTKETGPSRQQDLSTKKGAPGSDTAKAPSAGGRRPVPSSVDSQDAGKVRSPRAVAGTYQKDREDSGEEPIRRTRTRRTEDERIDAQYNEALRAMSSGQTGDARRIFNDILARRPGHLESLNNLGVIAASRGNKTEALSYFKKILEYEANYPKAYNNIGLVMMSDGQPQLAEEYFRKAISLEPNGLEPYMNLCAVLRAQGRFEDAEKIMEAPIRKNPKDPLLLLSYAVIKDNLGRTGEAVKYYRQYLSLAKPSDSQRNGVLERLKYLEGKK